MLYNIQEIATATSGTIFTTKSSSIANADGTDSRLDSNHLYRVSKISTDTRTITYEKETLFVAIKTKSDDGHNYIEEAIRLGVRTFLIDNSSYIQKQRSSSTLNFIVVRSSIEAIQKLAKYHRDNCSYPVWAIAGSNGKTIIKEWLKELLSSTLNSVRSPRSYNSQIGVPLSLLLMDSDHDLAIIETGISMRGEMLKLNKIISPSLAIVGHIGTAHIENFNSIEDLIREKLNIALRSDKIIYEISNNPTDNTVDKILREDSRFKDVDKVSWAIGAPNADLNITDISIDSSSSRIEGRWRGEVISISISLTDKASIENAIICLTTLLSENLLTESTIDKFKTLNSLAMRMEIKRGENSCTILNDSYSSDISSLKIALDYLHQHSVSHDGRETVIISDIEQTGECSETLYKRVAEELERRYIYRIVGVGKEIYKHQTLFNKIENRDFYTSSDSLLEHCTAAMFQNEAILIKGARRYALDNLSDRLQEKAHATVMEVNLKAMAENLRYIRSKIPEGCKVMAMVKAFSYGTGSIEVAELLQHHNIDYLAVAIADEGVELRKNGINVPIIIMNPEQHSFDAIIHHNLEPNIYSLSQLIEFDKILKSNAEIAYPVHLKIDSGMVRLGFSSLEELNGALDYIKMSDRVKVKSIFSHLAASDNYSERSFTYSQASLLDQMYSEASRRLNYPLMRHILNSAGVERYPEFTYDMVRLGISLYGISPLSDIKLSTVATLKSTISQIKRVEKGTTVGYNRSESVLRDSYIGTIPIGYADGLDRRLGRGVGNIYIQGRYAPFIGEICMDMAMIDLTDIPQAKEGDSVEIFGDNIDIATIADKINTISYEIITSIGSRVRRIYISD